MVCTEWDRYRDVLWWHLCSSIVDLLALLYLLILVRYSGHLAWQHGRIAVTGSSLRIRLHVVRSVSRLYLLDIIFPTLQFLYSCLLYIPSTLTFQAAYRHQFCHWVWYSAYEDSIFRRHVIRCGTAGEQNNYWLKFHSLLIGLLTTSLFFAPG